MGRWRDPWPLPQGHKPHGYCVLDGHNDGQPRRMVEILPLAQRIGLSTLMVCPEHDGDAADGQITSPMFNKPMCADPTCRMRAGHEGKHVPLAREMRR